MDAERNAHLAADPDDFVDEAFGHVVARGFRYAVEYRGRRIAEVRELLREHRIEFVDRTGVFGFRSARDARAFLDMAASIDARAAALAAARLIELLDPRNPEAIADQ